uniref:UBC core domain-containing protein n=1 Tax=Arcella intermedia TaxID=1963864 RepID=A0A6B2LN48_9EUKA
MKEYRDCTRDPSPNACLGPIGSNIAHWEAAILPGSESLYSGGLFLLDIKFPTDYPFKPPKIRFKTKIYHPNVCSEGCGCISMDILSDCWSPALTAARCLQGILALLDEPNPDNPMDSQTARQVYKTDRAAFNAKAKKWVLQYASSQSTPPHTTTNT